MAGWVPAVAELLAPLNFDLSFLQAPLNSDLNFDLSFLQAALANVDISALLGWVAPLLGLARTFRDVGFLFAAVLLAYYLVCRRPSPSKRAAARPRSNSAGDACANSAPEVGSLPKALDCNKNEVPVVFPPYRHMQGIYWAGPNDPRFAAGNLSEPLYFENEFCWGLWLPMFRPSLDPAHDTPEGWEHGHHFQDRKRLWEHRWELHLKVPLDGPVHFGIHLEEHVPLSRTTEKLMAVTVGMLKKAVGSTTVHHTSGDDPKTSSGERELPSFSMPMWAFDQFIETPEGLPPPSLVDRDFPSRGMMRSRDRKAFMAKMDALELRPGPTYSFAFWGIAQFMDAVKWSIQGVVPGMSIDFSNFCKVPPVHCSMYTVKRGSLTEDDPRHLESRKNVYFHLAFWSSTRPISQKKLLSFFPNASAAETQGITKKRSRSLWRACCTERSG